MASYEGYLRDLNLALAQLDSEPIDPLTKSQQGIQHSTQTLRALRAHLVSEGFKDQAAEIYFFKQVKPQVLGKLVYYRKLYVLECRRPRSSSKAQRRFWESQMKHFQDYLNNHQELYLYYRSGASYLDTHYFLRSHAETYGPVDALYVPTDLQFSTSHDALIATFMAYDQLLLHIKKALMWLEKHPQGNLGTKKEAPAKLHWTGHKIDLVELIYALYASGAINRGLAPINEIADCFETLLETDLGDYYHTYGELRRRKTKRTKFLDALKKALDSHMETLDQ